MRLWAKIYKFYRYKVYPYIFNVRGSTRLISFIEKKACDRHEKFQGEPTSVLEEEWDNLIIIDACRYDLFKDAFPNMEVDKRVSLGSSSSDFVRETFSDQNCEDTVCITGNPHYHESKFPDLTGKKADDVFHTVFHTYQDKFDEGKGTVLPDSIVKDAVTAEKLFPDKKKIIHFMQPHHPFIGTDSVDESQGFDQYLDRDAEEIKKLGGVWAMAELGEISHEKLMNGYRDNLEFVMNYVFDLAESLEGKTVVTADHGNLVGEKGLYAHPQGSDAKGLREVPWFKIK